MTLLLWTLTLLGIGGAIAAFVTGIVMACRRRWTATLIAVVALMLCTSLFLGGGFGLAVQQWLLDVEARSKQTAAHRQERIEAVKALTPGVDWTKIDDEFWTDDGLRDWWRTPIRWPYDVLNIDTLEEGSLRRNQGDGKSDHSASLDARFYFRDYACDGRSIVYRQVEQGNERWGWMEFDTEARKGFATEAEMWRWANEQGWKGPRNLRTVEENYRSYWQI